MTISSPDAAGDQRLLTLSALFVSLADTLVDDYDVVDLMDRLTSVAVDLFEVSAAGLLLRDQRGGLQVVACSSQTARVLELFQMQADEGPCRDCIAAGRAVTAAPLEPGGRWPRFTAAALDIGFTFAHAVPLRLRQDVVGGLNLFGSAPTALSDRDLPVVQALADVATIAILQQRSVHRTALLAEQLQSALNTRVVIEQAKGVLAQFATLDMEAAFTALRGYVRARNLLLGGVAQALVDGTLDPGQVVRQDDAGR